MLPSSGPGSGVDEQRGRGEDQEPSRKRREQGPSEIFGGAKAQDNQEGCMRHIIVKSIKKGMDLYYSESCGARRWGLSEVGNEEETTQIANDTEYGLSSAVFTKDVVKGLKMAKSIQSGAGHTDGMSVDDEPELPHGGVQSSGFRWFWKPWVGGVGDEDYTFKKRGSLVSLQSIRPY